MKNRDGISEKKGRICRFYSAELADGIGQAKLIDGEAHHAIHVMRLKAGQSVEVFNGRGDAAEGRVIQLDRSEVTVEISRNLPEVKAIKPAVHLAFAVPKATRLDWLLEKATELAATSLQPVLFNRSVAGGDELSEAKLQKWQSHCIAAAKQCGLNILPEIKPMLTLDEFLSSINSFGIFGDAGENSIKLADTVARRKAGGDIAILIGPEGGLTDDERSAALAAGLLAVRLGKTTLRTETAAVALLAAVRAICDEEF